MFFRCTALIVLFCAAAYFLHIRVHPSDPTRYQNLVQESIELQSRKALEHHPARQERRGVQKDLWLGDSHLCLKSDSSLLTLTQKKRKVTALEELKKMECSMEGEKEGVPLPLFLSAEEALCEFPLQEIRFSSGIVIRAAHDFFAEGGAAFYKNGSLTLTPSPCRLLRNGDRIDAEAIHFDLFKKELFAEGNVSFFSLNLQGKKSAAHADSLLYSLSEKRALLSAAFPKRVLFWQEGLSLSAPEIVIHGEETVEGKGDIHLEFDSQETNIIENLLAKYL